MMKATLRRSGERVFQGQKASEANKQRWRWDLYAQEKEKDNMTGV